MLMQNFVKNFLSFLTKCYWVHHWNEKNKIFCYQNRYDLIMFSKKLNDFNIEFLSKYWSKIKKSEKLIWIVNSKCNNFIIDDENSNEFVKQTNVIFENFQKSKMIQILIWNCQYWKFCRKIDWFSDSIIEIISVTKKKCRFVKINKYILWSIFE